MSRACRRLHSDDGAMQYFSQAVTWNWLTINNQTYMNENRQYCIGYHTRALFCYNNDQKHRNWQPVRQRVAFKVAGLVHQSLAGAAPAYILLTTVIFCLTLVVARWGLIPTTPGSCLCHEHTTNLATGVSRLPVLDCGTTFHPGFHDRDFPSIPLDEPTFKITSFWQLQRLMTYSTYSRYTNNCIYLSIYISYRFTTTWSGIVAELYKPKQDALTNCNGPSEDARKLGPFSTAHSDTLSYRDRTLTINNVYYFWQSPVA